MTRRCFVSSLSAGAGALVGVGQAARTQAPGEPERVVLEGVPCVGFNPPEGQGQEGFFFLSCLGACLEYLGEDPAYDYTYLLGTSGAAFGLLWPREGWAYCGDITDSSWTGPRRRAMDAVGYAYEEVPRQEGADQEAEFRRRIVESIRERGHPVIAAGVVGPPAPSIVAGYDEGGDVLIGWSYFQEYAGHDPAQEFEPSGYFRKRDWFRDTWGLTLIGDKGGDPERIAAYRAALDWALEVMRAPTVGDRHCGLAAYQAWAGALLRDEDFPADDTGTLLERLDCHQQATAIVAEGRWHGAQFLKRVADAEPDLTEGLLFAAACCEAETGLMQQGWAAQGGMDRHDEAVARKLAEPAVRRQIAPLILQARDQDAEAADRIERGLAGSVTAAGA